MKQLIFGAVCILLSLFFFITRADYDMNRQFYNDLRDVCEEASVAGALFTLDSEYANGRVVFNQAESIRAIEATIKSYLYLQDDFLPTSQSYWRDRVIYKAYFYDDSNTVYPYLFEDPDTGFTHLIKNPTVIVTINAGRGRFRLLDNGANNIRSAAHAWEGR